MLALTLTGKCATLYKSTVSLLLLFPFSILIFVGEIQIFSATTSEDFSQNTKWMK